MFREDLDYRRIENMSTAYSNYYSLMEYLTMTPEQTVRYTTILDYIKRQTNDYMFDTTRSYSGEIYGRRMQRALNEISDLLKEIVPSTDGQKILKEMGYNAE